MAPRSDNPAIEDQNRADWIKGLYAAWAECHDDVAWHRDYWAD